MALARLTGWIRQLVPEFAKFGVVGSIALVITDGGSNLLRFEAGLGPLTANAVATVAATVFAFLGNRYWTFRLRRRTGIGREGVLFFILNGAGLAIQLACIAFVAHLLGLGGALAYNLALAFGIGLGTLFRFWSYRRWVWLRPAPVPAVEPAEIVASVAPARAQPGTRLAEPGQGKGQA
jgi:putative flippase GtrA